MLLFRSEQGFFGLVPSDKPGSVMVVGDLLVLL